MVIRNIILNQLIPQIEKQFVAHFVFNNWFQFLEVVHATVCETNASLALVDPSLNRVEIFLLLSLNFLLELSNHVYCFFHYAFIGLLGGLVYVIAHFFEKVWLMT